MPTITVFDPPMCCSTGVCGPEVDPKLVEFASDLDWLKSKGVEIQRVNLSQEPGRFMNHPVVREILQRSGGDELPAILVGDELLASGRYPSRDELAARAGVETLSTP
ncbi:MAG: arsenical resistance operon transcriptional repressor ArsD [Gemmatimonadales bacterium]|nr:MAG: arsenical resistance operon transcriptional repressor ArsD [Gemmatimonadales bacterium]